jgi:hypothetical protein
VDPGSFIFKVLTGVVTAFIMTHITLGSALCLARLDINLCFARHWARVDINL